MISVLPKAEKLNIDGIGSRCSSVLATDGGRGHGRCFGIRLHQSEDRQNLIYQPGSETTTDSGSILLILKV